MSRRPSEVELLDSTVSALEQLILSASDDEIVSQDPRGNRAIDDVRTLIKRCLADRDALSQPASSAPERARAKSRRVSQASKDRANRLAFLQRLAAARPELSPRVRAVFSSGRTPTTKELDDLTEELTRLGLLPKGGPETK